MKSISFDRKKHLYKNEAFAELVKDAVRFFNGTPVHVLPPPETFLGTGVYALYYTGQNPLYPGRPWAERCNGTPKDKNFIVSNVEKYFKNIGEQS
jgi:hypothetical protein